MSEEVNVFDDDAEATTEVTNVPAVQQSGDQSRVSTGESDSDAINDLESELMKEVSGSIEENIELSELQIPRLAIIQPQSPEITGQEQGYSPGQMVDSITREILSDYGKPPWLKGKVDESQLDDLNFCFIVPVFKLPSEYIEWIPKNEQQAGEPAWTFKTLDKTDPKVRDGTWPPIGRFKGKKPPVTTNCNILCIIVDPVEKVARTNFIVVTFSRTSYNTGKELITNCTQHKMSGLPFWGRMYYLWTKKDSTQLPSGTMSYYYVFKISKGQRTLDVNRELNATCARMAMDLSGYKGKDENGKTIFDKESARDAQESLINSAVFSEVDEAGTDENKEEDDPFE